MEKQKIAPSLSLIGAILLVISAIYLISEFLARNLVLELWPATLEGPYTWEEIGVDPTSMVISFVVTLAVVILAGVGSAFALKNAKKGGIILIAVGAFAIIGMIIPIGSVDISSYLYPSDFYIIPLRDTVAFGERPVFTVNLVATGIVNDIPYYSITYILYCGPILILAGGILSYYLKEERSL